MTDNEYKRLYPNGSHIGVLNGLPKVHKPNVPTRPICSMVGTSTYELGKYIADIIKPAATSSLGTDPTNTFQYVEQIGREDLSDVHMISFDVKSLFTNIPFNKTIKICLDRQYRGDPGKRPSIPKDTLKKLLELCVCDNIFVFNGKVYKQVDGVAMGSSLGPLLPIYTWLTWRRNSISRNPRTLAQPSTEGMLMTHSAFSKNWSMPINLCHSSIPLIRQFNLTWNLK